MTLFAIPSSWAWTTLGELADVVGGVTKDSKRQSDPALPLVPYLRVANVQRGHLDLTEVAQIRVPESTLDRLRLMPGDVLLNEGGDRDKLGRGWVWEGQIEDCIHQNHVFRARITSDALDPTLLALFANECGREWFERQASQTVNLASISLTKVKRLPVPVPPQAEQRRILAALEDHLSRIVAGRRLLTRVVARLSVLSDTIVEHELRQGAYPSLACDLEGLLREPLRNGHSARRAADGCGVRAVTLTAVTRDDFSEANTKVTSADPTRVRDLWLEPGDILIQRANTPDLVGTAAMYSGQLRWAIFPDLLIRVRVNSLVLPEYLMMVLRSRSVRDYLRSSAKGLAGSMPKIDQSTILRTKVPLPSLQVQEELVTRVRDQHDSASRLQEIVTLASRRAGALQRSLLVSGFSGNLLPQDPSDEPAEVLLERIRRERAARPKQRRGRRTTSGPQEEALL